MSGSREVWGTRLGLILAMAGNAVGLGNFLRFPRQAALNGGGAFMIPYFAALLLLGIPLMWVEWAIGRFGGQHGHGTTPGMFALLWRHPAAKYLGALGVAIPLCFVMYYTTIEGWTLGFSVFSAIKHYWGVDTYTEMSHYLGQFQGRTFSGGGPTYFSGLTTVLLFYLATLGLNLAILARGVSRGIERLAKIALPALFLFAAVLVVRVITLPTPDPTHPAASVAAGFAYVWNPNFSLLANPAVWLAAAGQIFFTLSIGTGSIHTYASYVRADDDIVLTGLTTSATNEFAEVILGGSIAIPVAVAFFGLAQTQAIAKAGSFDLGFAAMPLIFQKMGALGPLYGCLWFALLFFAGITSSVALAQPSIAFFQDEFGWLRSKAVAATGALMLVGGLPCVFFLAHGFLDEMDFWAGTFFLVVFGVIEVILFAWVFGIDRAWSEINRGADIRLPRVVRTTIRYVTPLYLIVMLAAWTWKDAMPVLRLKGHPVADAPYMWGARLLMVGVLALFLVLVGVAWRRRHAGEVRP
jgi:neurotransmitter:Na+ symporter, NSS family